MLIRGVDQNDQVTAVPSVRNVTVNAPASNVASAAELAVGLMLAAARHISPASQALKGGAWKRSKFGGVELLDKTVGIVGLGRIGALVADIPPEDQVFNGSYLSSFWALQERPFDVMNSAFLQWWGDWGCKPAISMQQELSLIHI